MKAIGYVRVSTDQQAESGLSLAAQRVKVEAQCTVHDYELAATIEDAGASAKTLDRPGWAQVMRAVRGAKVDVVVIAKLDRCTRSVADLGRLLEDLGKARRADGGRGVALVSCAESLDTSSAGGRLVLNVLGAVAQWEREATAERTSAALQALRSQGRRHCNVAPYGSRFIDGRRVADAGEQATIAAIVAHRAAGLSWAKVAAAVNAEGHRTRTGGAWSRQGVHQAAGAVQQPAAA